MEQNLAYVVIVGCKLIYACSRLKAENVDVIVFAGQRKGFLARKLTSHRYATLTDKERFFTLVGIGFKVEFVHFNKAVV